MKKFKITFKKEINLFLLEYIKEQRYEMAKGDAYDAADEAEAEAIMDEASKEPVFANNTEFINEVFGYLEIFFPKEIKEENNTITFGLEEDEEDDYSPFSMFKKFVDNMPKNIRNCVSEI